MQTQDLIALLARSAAPPPAAPVLRRLGPAALAGVLLAALLALQTAAPVPVALLAEPGLWLKFGYALAMVGAAGWLAGRLARPAAAARQAALVLALIVALMLLAGGLALGQAPAGRRLALVLGHSWWVCPSTVLALSLPALGAGMLALRQLAPTRLRLAGLALGLLAGACGALGYALVCTEISPAFVAVWYSLGMGLAGGLGALLGPRLLRW